MPRFLVAAAFIFALSGRAAQAQIHDITSAVPEQHKYGWSMWPPITPAQVPEDAGREHDIDLHYRETLKSRIPNRKPAKDPWRTIRSAPAVPYDKHRTE